MWLGITEKLVSDFFEDFTNPKSRICGMMIFVISGNQIYQGGEQVARMHARRRGKSGSVRPNRSEAPAWSNTDNEEIVKIIVELRKTGMSSAEIGLILRDKYGVPSVKLATGKRIVEILAENGIESEIPEDLRNLIIKALGMRKHLSENKKDVHNKRQLHLTEAKVRRLGKYYVRNGKMPAGWTYKADTAEFLLSR